MAYSTVDHLQELYSHTHRVYYCESKFNSHSDLNDSLFKDFLTNFGSEHGCSVIGGHLHSPSISTEMPNSDGDDDIGGLIIWYLIGYHKDNFASKLSLFEHLPDSTSINILNRRSVNSLIETALSNCECPLRLCPMSD